MLSGAAGPQNSRAARQKLRQCRIESENQPKAHNIKGGLYTQLSGKAPLWGIFLKCFLDTFGHRFSPILGVGVSQNGAK